MIRPMVEPNRFSERNLKLGLIVFLAAGVLLFLGFELQYLFAPQLTIIAPATDLSIRERAFQIVGRTDPDADVMVNGRPVFGGETGEFSERIELFPGVNEILIESKNRYGRVTAERRFIVVEVE